MKALALAFLLFATSPVVIDTTQIAEGDVQVRVAGSGKVAVVRMGSTVEVRVDEGKRTDTITITRKGNGELSISHRDNGEPRQLIGLDRRPVIVDGIDLEPYLASNTLGKQQPEPPRSSVNPPPLPERRYSGPRYFVCPKDQTMVRVPAGHTPGELFCPLDGTAMREGTGPHSQFFLLE